MTDEEGFRHERLMIANKAANTAQYPTWNTYLKKRALSWRFTAHEVAQLREVFDHWRNR